MRDCQEIDFDVTDGTKNFYNTVKKYEGYFLNCFDNLN